ncbi:MAG: ATP-binding protein [Methanomassiliicoccaceae archaeon]|nr:ATP-binding protein [Methanomassiliicoccaceae archaeon]
MERKISEDLLKWKNSSDRMPLLLQGVRQCGKTYILKEFGKKNYDDVAYFTFEKNPVLHDIFRTDLDPERLLEELSLLRKKKIEPGKTLLILDEIQLCGPALTSLKFFYEDAPKYHVASAGSLLGVMLSKDSSFPVGKVDRLHMYPMTFKEFLIANSEDLLVDHIDKNDPSKSLSAPIVNKLNTYLDRYFIVGGMPAAVNSWIKERDIEAVDTKLDKIIEDYKSDFSKHAPELLPKLTLIWDSIPVQLAKENKKFVFGHVKTGLRAKDLEDALQWLADAGLVYKVRKIDDPKVPMAMFTENTNFKLYMADIGILRRMAKMSSDFMFSRDKEFKDFRGAIAENFVLGELIPIIGDIPYYWKSDSESEIDFVAQIENTAVPIEAKAGNTKSKSLPEFIKKYDIKVAVTTTERKNVSSVVRHVPRYSLWRIRDHVKNAKREEREREI